MNTESILNSQPTMYLTLPEGRELVFSHQNKITYRMDKNEAVLEDRSILIVTDETREKLRLSQMALRNMKKRYKFLELNYDLASGQIDNDEYNRILDENEEQYVIETPKTTASYSQLRAIGEIAHDIDSENDFSLDDIEELFQLRVDRKILALEG